MLEALEDPAARAGSGRGASRYATCLLLLFAFGSSIGGLATPVGTFSVTGAAGLTLSGGFGRLGRRFGLACDNVASFDVVTADGRFLRANDAENADLYWGLRGGGGNFGVVTSIEYRLYPVSPVILGGMASTAGPVLGTFALLLVEEVLKGWTEHWQVWLGPLLVLSVIFFRRGLAGIFYRPDA